MKTPMILAGLGLLGALAISGCGSSSNSSSGASSSPASSAASSPTSSASASSDPGGVVDVSPPNILFIVMDDAGVDQFEVMGYGGAVPAQTNSINAIANAGVRFRNTWSMPTCSPTRSTFFNGLYPFRSGVQNAIVSKDLANAQLSPYPLTPPKLHKQEAGYASALIVKRHHPGFDLDPRTPPLGDAAWRELAWDYLPGYRDGAPFPID